jgi:hypothetical protein
MSRVLQIMNDRSTHGAAHHEKNGDKKQPG